MDEQTQKAFNELKVELQKALTEGVTKEVMTKVDDLLKSAPLRKQIFGSENAKSDNLEAKKKTAEYIKAKFLGNSEVAKSLSSGTSGEGLELAPEYFSSEVLRIGQNFGAFRRNARVIPVTTAKGHMPTAGNVAVTRVADGDEIAVTSSAGLTGQINYDTTKELVGLVPFSNQLLQDANVNLVDLLILLFVEARAGAEDEWGFLGLAGTEGIFRNTSVPVYTLPSGKTTYADFHPDHVLAALKLYAGIKALSGAKWYMSFSSFISILEKRGTAGEGMYLVTPPNGNLPATIWGFPVEFSDVFPNVADNGSQAAKKFAIFGNLQYAHLYNRQDLIVDVTKEATINSGGSPVNLWQKNMSAIRVISREDIQIAEPAKAFVTVKTAAS